MPKVKSVRMGHGVPLPVDVIEAGVGVSENIALATPETFVPVGTGLSGIDEYTSGGMRGGDLWLLGGMQNVGKTAAITSIARNMAEQDALAIFVCYEHSPTELLIRLICQEAFRLHGAPVVQAKHFAKAQEEVVRERLRNHARAISEGGDAHSVTAMGQDFTSTLSRIEHATEAWMSLAQYASNIWLVRGDSIFTTPEELEKYLAIAISHGYKRVVMIIDYLQKIPVFSTDRRMLPVIEGVRYSMVYIHEMVKRATTAGASAAVLSVAAAEMENLRTGRVHFEGLFGDSIITYEPSAALMMNWDIQPDDGYPIIRWGLEKNRNGPTNIEFRHKYYGPAYYFDPQGELVGDDESWQTERLKLVRERSEKDNLARLLAEALGLQGEMSDE